MFIYNKKLQVFQSSLFDSSVIISGFGTKQTVNSIISEQTFEYFKNYLQCKIVFSPQQTHSTNIETINDLINNDFHTIDNVDGLVTLKKGAALTVRTADCVPLIFADETKRIIGISHNGWKGSYENMSEKMIQKCISLGSNINDIKVAIGPSINSCCYEIYGERLEMFTKRYSEFADRIFLQREHKTFLNLQYLNYLQLIKCGINPNNIDHFPFCTSCDENRFDSYHRTNSLQSELINFIILH